MAIKGRFTIPSSAMQGSYAERTFNWVVDSWVWESEHRPESRPLHYSLESTSDEQDKEKIEPGELQDISEMYIRVESEVEGREPEYRFMAGPFHSVSEIDKLLTEAYEYGSPR